MSLSDEAPFEGTLRENITFGNPKITAAQIREIIEIVGLSPCQISTLGLDTIIYPEGKRLSSTDTKKILLKSYLKTTLCIIT